MILKSMTDFVLEQIPKFENYMISECGKLLITTKPPSLIGWGFLFLFIIFNRQELIVEKRRR